MKYNQKDKFQSSNPNIAKKNSEKMDLEEKKFDSKLLFLTIFAVLATLVFIYVIYTIIFRHETVYVEKFIFPQVNVSEEEEFGQEEIIKMGELDIIEENLRNNDTFQDLQEYGDLPIDIDDVGNTNPFQPFERVWGVPIPEETEAETVQDEPEKTVEKPLPVIN